MAKLAFEGVLLCILCLALSRPGLAKDWIVAEKELRFIARYPSGKVEHYGIQYYGFVSDPVLKEDGEKSDPLRGRFIDTRICSWNLRPTIEVAIYMINELGMQFESKEGSYDFAPDEGYVTGQTERGRGCDQSKSALQQDLDRVTAYLRDAVPKLAAGAGESRLQELRKKFGRAELTWE